MLSTIRKTQGPGGKYYKCEQLEPDFFDFYCNVNEVQCKWCK